MKYHFMDMGLDCAINFPIHTLGPEGTSSEYASQFFNDWMRDNYSQSFHNIELNQTYEEARHKIKNIQGGTNYKLTIGASKILEVTWKLQNLNIFFGTY